MASTATPSAAYLAQDKTASTFPPQIICFALASIVLPLRIVSRKLTGARFGYDDYFIFIAYICACGLFAVFITMSIEGVGKHIERVQLENPKGAIIMLQTLTPGEVLYTCSVCFSKFSILSLYWRIFGVTNMRKLIIAIACIVTGWMISVQDGFQSVTSGLSCRPLEYLWNKTIKGECIDFAKFYLIISYPNVITDWVMLIMPMRYVWKLQMPKRQKVVVSGLLFVGSFVCVISTIRLVFMSNVDLVDITWGLVTVTVWTSVECYSAIFCACLPSLKPLYNIATGSSLSAAKSSGTPYDHPRTRTWGKQRNQSNLTTASNNESVTRLRDDDYWVPTTTAYAAGNGESTNSNEEIHLENMETNAIKVKTDLTWGETKR
ncbi:hypothetical protein B7463_g936, partial [Scytalidium lignicola]